MSAIVMMAPGGIDDKLDFLPASYTNGRED
jgi:hypothetical protein